uniref:DH domain-containing protein n=1 Tax=Electrophorus electricus TaxID=8005 RepID=A0AAY5EZP9_ELEEL
MNHVRRRKQGNGKTAQSRSKWGKNEEDEGQPRGSAPCPVYGLVSVSPENGSDPFKGEVNAENTTSSRRSGKSKGCSQEDEDIQAEVEIDRELDRELENKSRQHKLTSANVRSILHEVITNEHVVAMMKAAINDTQPVPLFVSIGLSGPQFVDIPLEEEDSSDEEYCPDEEEDDETAEDTLLESDLESTASSPRGMRLSLNKSFTEHARENSCSPRQVTHTHSSPHPLLCAAPENPKCSFMEKLHAVDEELAIGSDCMHSYQSLGNDGEESLMAFRTRSKRPLRDVPLGRLEAELRAPDITPDMYEHGSTLEDREWTQWLQGLMSSEMENEEEADDEDDPEYNFLADIDEPDVEDYRNDKAVRITKKEVNDLMEELFDAFQDELGGQDEEGHEEEEDKEEEYVPQQQPPSVLETIQYEDPLADILNQRYSTVREQLAALRKRKALLESKGVPLPPPRPKRPSSPTSPLFLSPAQKLRLQQHVQQHVQLLTQVSMLSRRVEGLQTEACTTRQFLSELQLFAHRGEEAWRGIEPGFVSIFRACNLEPALMLLQDLDHAPDPQTPGPLFPGSQIAADLAWLLGTRPVFLYPELLPHVDLRPFHYKGPFTSAENCLVVLGHQHLKGTVHPLKLACQYLLAARNFICLRTHVRSACQKQSPNILKKYFIEGKCPPMPLACLSVSPSDQRPPVARHKRLMPWWLRQNLKLIHEEVRKYNQPFADFQPAITPPYIFPPSTRYPPRLPEALDLKPQPLPPPAGSCRRKAPLELHMQPSTQPSKPLPPAKGLEEALRRLTPILPKPGCPSAQNPIPIPQPEPLTLHLNAHSNRQQISSASSGTAAVSAANPQVALPDITNAADLNRAKLIVTLPAASLGPGQNLPSLGAVAVNPAEDTHIIVPNAAKVAPASPGQGNIVITLPAAPVATAFICPSPAAKQVAQRASAFASLAKDHMSECCGTLLKVRRAERLHSALLCDDLSDDDPRRDVKDVAFAQAYLEKVSNFLQVVPGKVEEFLGVLYEFEQDPEGRTSVDLYVRLRSVLGEWPELLRDFAAFLHPEQAQECGLLAEQQAFERSRRFLRQLELSFGEHSPHYRRVVRTLQQGPCKSRMKAQIAMLLREHVHLLEEYWVFFERLHPAKHRRSEEEEMECDNVDGVCSVQTVHRTSVHAWESFGCVQSVDSAKLAGESRSTNPETEDETKKEAGRAFCARNSSRMPSGEKVVLWTREADRVILTTCQQRGANQSTFRSIAAQLGHKTATEVRSSSVLPVSLSILCIFASGVDN